MRNAQVIDTAKRIRIELLLRNIANVELVAMTGLSKGTIRNIIGGSNQTRRGRAAIEQAIGIPIWSEMEEFLALKDSIKGNAARVRTRPGTGTNYRAKKRQLLKNHETQN